ncbi:MAG: hypothetical protein ACYTG1_03225 [Planctomycetota bacterium]|jgi:hypothetical protein
MLNPQRTARWLAVAVCTCSTVALAVPAAPDQEPAVPAPQRPRHLQQQFLATHPGARIADFGAARRVFGANLSRGASPIASAEAFRVDAMPMFGVEAGDLVPLPRQANGDHTLPLMFDRATGQPKFTAVYYEQQRGGVPVFATRLVTLVKNAPGHPVVLANPDVRPLGDFEVDAAVAAEPFGQVAEAVVRMRYGRDGFVLSSRKVIWAGLPGAPAAPRLADEAYVIAEPNHWRIVTDAVTGEVLHEVMTICFVDLTGNVSGLATDGVGADICEVEVGKPLPYLAVTAGLDTVFTDVNGDYIVTGLPAGPINISAGLDGQWFDVFNAQGVETTEAASVTPPDPGDLVFNSLNTSEQVRAEVNAYVESNYIRDWVLSHNPLYPTLQDGDFEVNVNRTDVYCPGNAWYSPPASNPSINFCLSSVSASRPNTSWTSVIYHEYGHHLVEAAGSGQGAYGEGMGDVVSSLLLDDPRLGIGFFNECFSPLRNADNSCQYQTSGCSSCGSAIHTCGQILSGAVWDTRVELGITDPANARDIIADLAINAMLLHTGSSITPDITIDYLTLDDDNGNIADGSPHYTEIAIGFGNHSLDAPPLSLLGFNFPNGQPSFVNPNGGTVLRVQVIDIAASAEPGTGRFFVDSGAGFTEVPMTPISGTEYDAVFPGTECGTLVRYYFEADTTGGATASAPFGAPASSFEAVAASGFGPAIFSDDFETDQGWGVTGDATDGQWDRGVPIGGGDRGDPPTDADTSGQCYLTDNVDGNSDVDGGSTTLTSPMLDASDPTATIEYWRWFSGSTGADDVLLVEVTPNNGVEWFEVETVGPSGPEADGGWFFKRWVVSDIPGMVTSNKFRVRFTANDDGTGSVVEAGVDGVLLGTLECPLACASDCEATPDGDVGVNDLLDVLAQWGGPGACDILGGDGIVGVDELLQVLADWGPCP